MVRAHDLVAATPLVPPKGRGDSVEEEPTTYTGSADCKDVPLK